MVSILVLSILNVYLELFMLSSKVETRQNCCFIGHREIRESDALIEQLRKEIINLIKRERVDIFLFGSKSEFNRLCHRIVTELKNEFPNIKRIYVRAEFPIISESYEKYLLESYEETYFPEKILNSGKAAYVERNYEMINRSDFCIAYYDEKRKGSSGTRLAYRYALRKRLNVKKLFVD